MNEKAKSLISGNCCTKRKWVCVPRWWRNIIPISSVLLRTVEIHQCSGCSHMIPVPFEAFPKEVQVLSLECCALSAMVCQPLTQNISHKARARTLIALSLCSCSHIDLCAQHSPLNLWLQQGNKHTTCSEQAVSKKYPIFYISTVSAEFCRVLQSSMFLLLSVLFTLTK